MEYLFEVGFLGTRAPFFIDMILLIAIALPILLSFSIFLAIRKHYKSHHIMQSLLFFITLSAFLMLQYEIQIRHTFESLITQSAFQPNAAFYYYIGYTIYSVITLILWYATLAFAKADRQRRALPGLYSSSHKQRGRMASILIIVMAAATVSIYWILFVT